MQWFYSQNGQQIGPVAFSEIERLRAEGQLSDESLVWQEGTPDWIPLSQASASPPAPAPPTPTENPPVASGAPVQSVVPAGSPSGASAGGMVPDYGDILCWGFIAILLPGLGILVFIALIVMHGMEFLAARKEVAAGRLTESSYSRISPVLFFLGLICCSWIFYPVFMHLRNLSGYFKPQPHAVWVSVAVIVIAIGVGVILQFTAAAIQSVGSFPQ